MPTERTEEVISTAVIIVTPGKSGTDYSFLGALHMLPAEQDHVTKLFIAQDCTFIKYLCYAIYADVIKKCHNKYANVYTMSLC